MYLALCIKANVSGPWMWPYPLAEHTAVVAAVRHMESTSNALVKDLNYNRLKQLQRENKYLKNELKKAKFKSTRLGRGWFLSLRHIRSFAT
jgi:hypothetical protein